jgi:hypothetical protein
MARRRKVGAAISLFAFQDIITSVSAILIFVTLLMTLDLLDRRPDGGDAAQAAADDLRSAIAETTARRDALRARSRQVQQKLHALTDASPDDLRRKAELAEAEAADLDGQVRRLAGRVEQAGRRVEQAEARVGEAEDRRRELAALEEEAESLDGQVADEADGNRVYYNVVGGRPRAGWLVEVSRDRIAAAPLDREARPVVFDRGRSSGCAEFLAWVAGRGDYLLLAVRPGGGERFDAIADTLRASGHPFGYDPIAEDQEVFDPERGAFRP